jgi:ABC-type bacteriocin/lantibiotic exporter with double-glycine peptidase domain
MKTLGDPIIRGKSPKHARIPFHFQLATNDCAPACVMAIVDYYRLSVDVRQLRATLFPEEANGVSIRHFQRLSRWFNVQLGRADQLQPDSVATPYIAYWPKQSHYVVVWRVTATAVTLGDPAVGVVRMSRREFCTYWDGIAIVLQPYELDERASIRSRPSLWKVVQRLFYHQWYRLILLAIPATALGVINAIFAIAFPFFLQNMRKMVHITLGFVVISLVLSAVTGGLTAFVKRRIALDIVRDLAPNLQRLSPQFYTVGDAYTRFQDVQHVVDAITGLARDLPYAIMIWMGALWYLTDQASTVAGVMIGLLVVVLGCLSPFVRRVRNYFYLIRLRTANLNNSLIRSWGGRIDTIYDPWQELVATTFHQSLWNVPITTVMQQTSSLGIVAVGLFAGLHSHRLGMAPLLSLIFLVNYMTGATYALYTKYVSWQTTTPSLFRIQDFLNVTLNIISEPDSQ